MQNINLKMQNDNVKLKISAKDAKEIILHFELSF